MSPPLLRKATRLMRAGAPTFTDGAAPVNVPVERTSTVRFENTSSHATLHKRRDAGEAVSTYGRHGTQTHRALEAAIGELEEARDVLLAPSGLSAISLVFIGLLSPGDHVLVHDGVYGPVRERIEPLLTRLGVEFSYFSAADGLPHKLLQRQHAADLCGVAEFVSIRDHRSAGACRLSLTSKESCSPPTTRGARVCSISRWRWARISRFRP